MSKPEVIYTGRELYRLCSDDGAYDGKIDVHSDGTMHVYESKDAYWDDHSHAVYDRYGNYIGGHPDGENHPWDDRFHD